MTEQEWLNSTDPVRMLQALRGNVRERKLGLFALACCQELVGNALDPQTRDALAFVEYLAETEGLRSRKAITRIPPGQVVIDCGASEPVPVVRLGNFEDRNIDLACLPPVLSEVLRRLGCGGAAVWWLEPMTLEFAQNGLISPRQADILRDVVRGSSRPVVLRAPWLRWNDGVLQRLAEAIYRDRAFNQLPFLHDALLDAGCDDDELLGHCRQPGDHVRGCWLIDLLLDKKQGSNDRSP
jgi:hypothetical protein